MTKIIKKGIDENGRILTEHVSTAVLATQMIENLPMCQGDAERALEEIRKSAELDERMRKLYASNLNNEIKKRREIEKRLEEGITKRMAMAKECEEMDDKGSAERCYGFSHAFSVALAWIQNASK